MGHHECQACQNNTFIFRVYLYAYIFIVAWNASAVGSPLSQAVASPGVYLVNALIPNVYPIYSWTHTWFWPWFVVELVEHFPVVYG